jgi:UDP-N-acetylmuramoyl-tripeptide--D-alanyl-D-alanine ligase
VTFDDPFTGYSVLLRILIYGVIPLFTLFQVVRFRRALHIFQLEGYKRARFLEWCRADLYRALFLRPATHKKPLVMTGRAWRLLITATLLSLLAVLILPGLAHVGAGWPLDVLTWLLVTALVFAGLPALLVAADLLLAPIQSTINRRFTSAARSKLDGISPTVIGITGSFGKTSTKFAIAGLLGDQALATPGSFNTPLGVSRTINEQLDDDHRFFVVEMGAYGEGEIAEICELVRPKIGVLTSIGPAHLERFGSLETIARAKYEIVTSLSDEGTAVMNTDDQRVRELADGTKNVPVIRYGLDPSGRPDVTARAIEQTANGTKFEVVLGGEWIGISTRLLGRYAVGHVLAGIAVATALGHPLVELRQRIEALPPVEHRLQLLEGTGGVTVIDDAYNSNPDGAAVALDVLAAMPGERKVVVTPGMIELGELQYEENMRFAEYAGRIADFVVAVARVNRTPLVEGARRGGRAEVVMVDSLDEAQRVLAKLLRSGDVVLFENDLPDQYER